MPKKAVGTNLLGALDMHPFSRSEGLDVLFEAAVIC